MTEQKSEPSDKEKLEKLQSRYDELLRRYFILLNEIKNEGIALSARAMNTQAEAAKLFAEK